MKTKEVYKTNIFGSGNVGEKIALRESIKLPQNLAGAGFYNFVRATSPELARDSNFTSYLNFVEQGGAYFPNADKFRKDSKAIEFMKKYSPLSEEQIDVMVEHGSSKNVRGIQNVINEARERGIDLPQNASLEELVDVVNQFGWSKEKAVTQLAPFVFQAYNDNRLRGGFYGAYRNAVFDEAGAKERVGMKNNHPDMLKSIPEKIADDAAEASLDYVIWAISNSSKN